MIDHWFGRFKKNLWQESDRMELVEEEDVLGLGYWAASAFGDWLNGTLNRWISNTLETNRPAGNVHLSHWNIICGLWKMFLLGWWRLVASTFAASAYLNMILLNKEVILWLLIPLENPQILDLIKHQKTKHCLVMLCLHCLCGICCFVADFSFSNFSNACR